jgi:hypothetical protein
MADPRERREHRIFRVLIRMVPGLEERLMDGSDEDVVHIAELVRGLTFLLLFSSTLLDNKG